ncbi:hypothetical protein K9M79_08950 [Candidatus Woesearchaeota archaeon]|nr:hypothetical protein [Candidatus Woesearchaeota archaeon]
MYQKQPSPSDNISLDVDIREFRPHRYDRNIDTVADLMKRAETGHRIRTLNGNGQPPLSFHLVTWDTTNFTMYMPKYDWLYYEPEGDMFLSAMTAEHNTGFQKLGNLCDLMHVQDDVRLQKDLANHKGKEIEFLAYHMTPVKNMDRSYQVLNKLQLKG